MTKSIITASMIALTINLSACASFDKSPAAQVSLTAEISALDTPASWVLGEDTDGEIADSWTSVLDDDRLNALITEGLKNNPSLRSSAESVTRSEALLKQSRSSLLPSLGADISSRGEGALEGDDFSDSYSAGLSASWEADLWGGIQADIFASGYDLIGTRAAYESARQALIAEIARAYILCIEANLLVALNEQTLKAQEETLRIVSIRYDLGASSRQELVLAEADVAGARDNYVASTSTKIDAVLALQVLLGRYPDGNLAISPSFPQLKDTLNAGTPTDLLRRRPDVITAEFDVLSAFETTRATRADRWPSLSLSAGLDTNSSNLGDILDPVSIAFSLGAQLADTLFDGGLTQARIDAASASQRQALANYGQTALEAYFDVESSLNTIDTLNERSTFVQQGADAARETLALADIQYKEGATDLLDVLTLRQRSLQADQTQIILQRQSIEARIALYLALGGGNL